MLHTKHFLPTRAIYYSRRLRRVDFYFYRAMRWRHQDGPTSPSPTLFDTTKQFLLSGGGSCSVISFLASEALRKRSTIWVENSDVFGWLQPSRRCSIEARDYRASELESGKRLLLKWRLLVFADDVMRSLLGSQICRIMEICWKEISSNSRTKRFEKLRRLKLHAVDFSKFIERRSQHCANTMFMDDRM